MIPGILTLIAGIAIVVISFFLTDEKKGESTENDSLSNNKEQIEKELSEYCDSLVEKKKSEMKKQGDDVKANMKKGLDEVKESAKKDLAEIKESTKAEINEVRETSKKEIEEFRLLSAKNIEESKSTAQEGIDNMRDTVKQDLDKVMADYQASMTDARTKMQSELERCSSQLSEKAKKQMIDYINQSLTEAYEAYDPDDTSEKEPITYEETDGDIQHADEETEVQPENVAGEADEQALSADNVTEAATEEVQDGNEGKVDIDSAFTPEETAGVTVEQVSDEADQGKAVVVEEKSVTDSAFTVVEAENPQKTAEDISNSTAQTAPKNNSRSRRKKKKRSGQTKPIDIWDEGSDVESQVADMHKKGLSIMEIANKLGIGVGEAKVIIDKIDETDKQ